MRLVPEQHKPLNQVPLFQTLACKKKIFAICYCNLLHNNTAEMPGLNIMTNRIVAAIKMFDIIYFEHITIFLIHTS